MFKLEKYIQLLELLMIILEIYLKFWDIYRTCNTNQFFCPCHSILMVTFNLTITYFIFQLRKLQAANWQKYCINFVRNSERGNWRKYCINYVSPHQGLPLTKCPKQTASNIAQNNLTFEIFTTKNKKQKTKNNEITIFLKKRLFLIHCYIFKRQV